MYFTYNNYRGKGLKNYIELEKNEFRYFISLHIINKYVSCLNTYCASYSGIVMLWLYGRTLFLVIFSKLSSSYPIVEFKLKRF